jgi:hypothetical protein
LESLRGRQIETSPRQRELDTGQFSTRGKPQCRRKLIIGLPCEKDKADDVTCKRCKTVHKPTTGYPLPDGLSFCPFTTLVFAKSYTFQRAAMRVGRATFPTDDLLITRVNTVQNTHFHHATGVPTLLFSTGF